MWKFQERETNRDVSPFIFDTAYYLCYLLIHDIVPWSMRNTDISFSSSRAKVIPPGAS